MKTLRAVCKTTHPKTSALVKRGELIDVDDGADLALFPYYEPVSPAAAPAPLVFAGEKPAEKAEPSRLELLRTMSAEDLRKHLDMEFTKTQLDEFSQRELGSNPPNRLSKADTVEWVADLIEMDSA